MTNIIGHTVILGMPVIEAPYLDEGMGVVPDEHGQMRAAKSNEKPIGVIVVGVCKNCGETRDDHAPKNKCLFEATSYEQSDPMHVQIRLNRPG